jgi:hypothetical protein
MERKQIEELSKHIGKPEGLYLSNADFDFSRDFKHEWNPAEMQGVENWIEKLFKPILRKIGVHESIYDYFGLAYTSSSDCAMFGVCNVQHYMDNTHYISFFGLNNGGYLFIVCCDEEGNEVIYGIDDYSIFD